MEDAVHLPSGRELKVVGIWGNNLRDLKGAFSLRGHLSRREVDLQVLEIQPDLHFNFPEGDLCSNPLLNGLSGLSVGSGGLFVSSIEKFKMFVESGEECLSDQGVGSGLETHHE